MPRLGAEARGGAAVKRPMTVYRSGIVTCGGTLYRDCADCGKPQTRTVRFTGVDAEERMAAWEVAEVRCIACWRRAGRPA